MIGCNVCIFKNERNIECILLNVSVLHRLKSAIWTIQRIIYMQMCLQCSQQCNSKIIQIPNVENVREMENTNRWIWGSGAVGNKFRCLSILKGIQLHDFLKFKFINNTHELIFVRFRIVRLESHNSNAASERAVSALCRCS